VADAITSSRINKRTFVGPRIDIHDRPPIRGESAAMPRGIVGPVAATGGGHGAERHP
jgi:hypothetical protein